MRQVPEVAKHATLVIDAPLAGLVALILGMRTDKGEDALQHPRRKLGGVVCRDGGRWEGGWSTGALGAELIGDVDGAGRLALLLVFAAATEESHFGM